MRKTSISLCLPVYNSEKFLQFCLGSIARQDFKDFEIVIVNDCSPGTDEQGNSCKKIVKQFCRANRKIPVNYIENSKNSGTLETRRAAVYAAKGDYILVVDSDDFLAPGALQVLYEAAVSNDADIVQGATIAGIFPDNAATGELTSFIPAKLNRYSRLVAGSLNNHDIYSKAFNEGQMSTVLWGKLIRRELYLDAFDKIIPSYINLSEEFPQFFFITLFAKKYVGVDKLVYYYRQNSGMTAARKITTIKEFSSACSTASAHTMIYNWLCEQQERNGQWPLSDEEIDIFRGRIRYFVRNNLLTLHKSVDKAIYQQARDLLCDYWGQGLVDTIEEMLKKEEESGK